MTSLSRAHLLAALFFCALIAQSFSARTARSALLEREPAFRDNFYDAEIRGNLCWIVGYYGTILHSTDRGRTWEIQRSGTQEALFRVVFLDDKSGWVSGSYGTILHTEDGGRNWRIQPAPTQEQLFGLDLVNERVGWAVGSRGVVLHTGNAGASWINRPLHDDVILNDVRFINLKEGWLVGEFGRIYQTGDGGRTWLRQKSPIEVSFVSGESRNLFRLLFPDSAHGWAFGLDGVILETRNGKNWETIRQDGASSGALQPRHLFSASFFGDKKWAVGERGTVLFSPLRDEHWTLARLKTPLATLNGIAFGSDGFGLIVGNGGTILRTDNGGREWSQIRITTTAPGRGVSARP